MVEPVIHELHGLYAFWCPVCGCPHRFDKRWAFNGDMVKPTLSSATPGSKFSFLTYADISAHDVWRLERPGKMGDIMYGTEEAARMAAEEHGLADVWEPVKHHVAAHRKVYCHTYIREGMCQVLPDSSRLGGKTVPLEPWDPTKWR